MYLKHWVGVCIQAFQNCSRQQRHDLLIMKFKLNTVQFVVTFHLELDQPF